MTKFVKIDPSKHHEIYTRHKAGASLKTLAKEYGGEYGVSAARISQICKQVRHEIANADELLKQG